MKIITWNCNMTFRKKWSAVIELNPDILIIQECEHESKYQKSKLIPNYNEFIWLGDNLNKGIGILSFNNYKIELSENYNEDFKYIIPVKVSGDLEFNLFAIWAMPHKSSKVRGYVGQVWSAVKYYKSGFEALSILIGDWNSSAKWDSERKNGNHSHVTSLLNEYNIKSIYHELRKEEQGSEHEPTFYFRKSKDDTFHIDYCFGTESMINENTTMEIGSVEDWIELSDHMPLIIDNLGG